jgi:pSer/pThr/pTyr-binding forkhead associated (FHA) protein
LRFPGAKQLMKDGHTVRIQQPVDHSDADEFFAKYCISLIIEKGPAAGEEFVIECEQTIVGRGSEADFSISDDAMSREHVAFELQDDGFRVRDLASTNGMKVNGAEVLVADLKHGDSIEIGNAILRFVLEPIEKSGKTHWIRD